MKNHSINSETLPLKFGLRTSYALSLFIALLVLMVSVIGVLYQNTLYPTEDLLYSFLPNDVVNLIIGLPLLLISMWLTKKGKLIGLLCWPGALFYMIFVFFPYIIAVPFNILFLPYLLIFSLGIYTLIGILVNIDSAAIKNQLSSSVPAKISGGILIGLGVLNLIRHTALIFSSLMDNKLVSTQELALWVADFAIGNPLLLISGLFLWKKKPFGYVASAGLFLVYALLSLGLIPFFIIQSNLTNISIDMIAIVIVTALALVCLVPFTYFVRGSKNNIVKTNN